MKKIFNCIIFFLNVLLEILSITKKMFAGTVFLAMVSFILLLLANSSSEFTAIGSNLVKVIRAVMQPA